MKWTADDELNLHKWIDDKGIKIVYLPQRHEWGFHAHDKPTVILGGFKELAELKQYLSNLKGDRKNVRAVQEGDFLQEVEKAGGIPKLH